MEQLDPNLPEENIDEHLMEEMESEGGIVPEGG